MARFFLAKQHIQGNMVYITGEDVKHITKVLRLNVGDTITVCTGDGQDAVVKLKELTKDQVIGEVVDSYPSKGEPTIGVTLIQGLPKGDKLELIIQKCTEIGIKAIWPIETTRTIVQLDHKKAEQRQLRWQRVAMEAAKQCGRGVIPEVKILQNWSAVWSQIPDNALVIMPWESSDGQGLKALLTETENPEEIFILIGPEGGFTAEEVEVATTNGGKVVTLGPRILRTETAGMATLSMVLYHFGDLG